MMEEYHFTAHARRDLDAISRELVRVAGPYRVVGMFGAMGVGKTTLIQSVCRHLGVRGEVTSPTFALVNEYPVNGTGPVYHFDFYRITDISEALDFGIDEYFASGCWCLMEWSERIAGLLPPDLVQVHLTEQPGGSRSIRILIPG